MTATPVDLCAAKSAELESLTSDPKYGPLAARAFKVWCSEIAKPATCTTGVHDVDGSYAANKSDRGCCLIGAAVLGEKAIAGEYETARSLFNLTQDDTDGLWSGFDGKGSNLGSSRHAFEFGCRVRLLVESIFGDPL